MTLDVGKLFFFEQPVHYLGHVNQILPFRKRTAFDANDPKLFSAS